MATNPVVSAILSTTTDSEVRAAMLMGSWFESSWNENATQGAGGGEGAFQLSPGGPGHTSAQAYSPTASAQIMLPAYQAAVKSIPQSLWTSNPELAAEQAAVAAERPAHSYLSSYGQQAVNTAWTNTESALGGNTSFTSSATPGTSSSGISNALGSLGISDLSDMVERGGLIILGAVLVFIGIWRWGASFSGLSQAKKSTYATAATTAEAAA